MYIQPVYQSSQSIHNSTYSLNKQKHTQFRHVAGETNVWDCHRLFFHSVNNSLDRARMPRSGKHVSGSSSNLSLEKPGYVDIVEKLVMPQFKSTVFIWVSAEKIQCLFSLWICEMTVSNIHVHRKGVPMASNTVNRPGDVGTLKCAFLTKYFDSAYVFFFFFFFSLCGVFCDCYLSVCSRLKIRDCFDSFQRSLLYFPRNFNQRR